MKRREVIAALGAGVMMFGRGPSAAAQGPSNRPRIGVLLWGYPDRDVYWEPLRQGLRELGYVEGRDIELDARFAEGSRDRALAAMRDFAQQRVDVIVASQTPSATAAKAVTATIPVVMAPVADALATGLVASMARPGGNLTGISAATPEAVAKGVEALRQLMPALGRVGFLGSTRDPNAPTFLRHLETTTAALGIQVRPVLIATAAEAEGAFDAMLRDGVEAVVVQPIFANDAAVIAPLATRRGLPTASSASFAKYGSILVGYGAAPINIMRPAAVQIDKILKGAKPGDLPIEQPTHFELVVNMKVAKELRLTVPDTLIARADEVIE
jgi:putative ABC transport system substrate-binding protein